MGKRSNFERRERDFYPTPYEAVLPLLPHLAPRTHFDEPCYGKYALVDHLVKHGHTAVACTDIQNGADEDALNLPGCCGDYFITNPPWPAIGQHGDPTIAMALHLSNIAPTWFLLSADFAHNRYFAKVADRCAKIVSVGRVKWIPDSKGPGKDNCAWYLFDPTYSHLQTQFFGRT